MADEFQDYNSGKGYDHGVGTGKHDMVFDSHGQARSAFADWLLGIFGRGGYKPPVREGGGRTVKYESHDGQKVVTVRVDKEKPSTVIPDLAGSIDATSKIKGVNQPRNPIHIGYKKE